MNEVLFPKALDIEKFLSGQNPQWEQGPAIACVTNIAAFQAVCDLHGEGRFVASLAAVCDRPDIKRDDSFQLWVFRPETVTGVMVHVFDTQDKSSRLFVMDAKDGAIDWDRLRNTLQNHTQNPHAHSTHYESADVVETQINQPSVMTRMIAEELSRQMTDASPEARKAFIENAQRIYNESVAPSELRRMQHAIVGALEDAGRRDLSAVAAYQAVQSKITDPAKQVDWQVASLSDTMALQLRERWTGNYASMQQQYTPHQAAALSMVQVTSEILRTMRSQDGYDEQSPHTDEVELESLRLNAIKQAQREGISDWQIGAVRNHSFMVWEYRNPGNIDAWYTRQASYWYGNQMPAEYKEAAAKMMKQYMDASTQATPAAKFAEALQQANSMMSLMPGIDKTQLPTVTSFNQSVDERAQVTKDCAIYTAMMAGELPNDLGRALQSEFIDQLVIAGATREIMRTDTFAIAMHKAANHLQMLPELQGNEPAQQALGIIRMRTFEHLAERGYNLDQIAELLDDPGDIGDDTVGNDSL